MEWKTETNIINNKGPLLTVATLCRSPAVSVNQATGQSGSGKQADSGLQTFMADLHKIHTKCIQPSLSVPLATVVDRFGLMQIVTLCVY